VREPREYRQGHIEGAELFPLRRLLDAPPDVGTGDVVLVFTTGRRSTRAAHLLRSPGAPRVRVLDGGMRAWEAEGYLAAVEPGARAAGGIP
jgi:SulP family sulfate permease